MNRRGIPNLATRRCEVADRLLQVTGLLVGIDFDGTVAPIVANPETARMTSECRTAVERLSSHPRAAPAIISGRELTDLIDRVDIPGVVYVGNHGLELLRGESIELHREAANRRPAVRRAVDLISHRLSGINGWEIEDKRFTASVHVRQVAPSSVEKIRSVVNSSVREVEGELRVVSGREVIEIRPAIDWDKGSVLEYLSQFAPSRWGTVYIGDDITDEDAFRAVSDDGIGLLVGARERSNADYRLSSQAEVAPFLEWLVGMLDAADHDQHDRTGEIRG